MKRSWPIWLLAFAIIALGSGGQAQLRRERASLAVLSADHTACAEKIAEVKVRQRAEALSRASTAQRIRRAKQTRSRESDAAAQVRAMASKRKSLAYRYHAFEVERKLTPEQMARLEDCMLEREVHSADVTEAVQHQGPALGSRDFFRLAEESQTDSGKQVANIEKQILGEDGYAALQSYSNLLAAREHVTAFAGAAAVSDAALSHQELTALSNAIAPYIIAKSGSVNRLDWDAAAPAVSQILTPRQWALFNGTDMGASSTWAQARAFQALYDACFAANAGE